MHDQSRHRSMDTLRMFATPRSSRITPARTSCESDNSTWICRVRRQGPPERDRARYHQPLRNNAQSLSRAGVPFIQHRFLACQSRNLCCQGFQRSLAALLRGQIERGIASIVWERQHLGK